MTPGKPHITSWEDILDIQSVPLAEREFFASTCDLLSHSAGQFGKRTALEFFITGKKYKRKKQYSYTDLHRKVCKTANLLHGLGVDEDSTVSVMLPNLPETLFAIWGAEAVGKVHPINPGLEAEEIAEQLALTRPKVLITLGPFPGADIWDKVEAIRPGVESLETILLVDPGHYLGFLEALSSNLFSRGHKKAAKVPGQHVGDFNRSVQKQKGDGLNFQREYDEGTIAGYFPTGGTTGQPKLVALSHRNIMCSLWSVTRFVDATRPMTYLCGLPLFHVFGLLLNAMAPLSLGFKVVLASTRGYFDPDVADNFWKIIERYQVGIFQTVPPFLTRLAELPRRGADISSLVNAGAGDSFFPREELEEFERKCGVPVIQGYGATEATSLVSLNPLSGDKGNKYSAGWPLPYMEVLIAHLSQDGEFVRRCDVGEEGEILLRGPQLFDGYLDEELNQNIWIGLDDGGKDWFRSRDFGYRDKDNFLWIRGRRQDLIRIGDEQVFAEEIEELMHRHPKVALAAAVPKPDKELGQVPVLYVEPMPGQKLEPKELHEFARGGDLQAFAIPRGYRIISKMPLSPVGKVYKPPLMEEEGVGAIEGVFEEARLTGKLDFYVQAQASGTLVVDIYLPAGADQEFISQVENALQGMALEIRFFRE